MKFCRYCGSEMLGEFETNSQNSQKFKAFYICPKCHSTCDGEYSESKKEERTINEKWWNPMTNEIEN